MMQQLSMFDLMITPKEPPQTDEPTWFRIVLDKKGHSYSEIGVTRNKDQTWSCTSRDTFQGFCGHGGPFGGEYPRFNDALANRLRYLRKDYQRMADGKAGSCCSTSHQAMARAGLKWLDELAAEYSIDTRNDA